MQMDKLVNAYLRFRSGSEYDGLAKPPTPVEPLNQPLVAVEVVDLFCAFLVITFTRFFNNWLQSENPFHFPMVLRGMKYIQMKPFCATVTLAALPSLQQLRSLSDHY